MRATYEEVRIAPNIQLTQGLMAMTLEDELATEEHGDEDDHAEFLHTIAIDPARGQSSDRGVEEPSNTQEAPQRMSDNSSGTLLADSQPPVITPSSNDPAKFPADANQS